MSLGFVLVGLVSDAAGGRQRPEAMDDGMHGDEGAVFARTGFEFLTESGPLPAARHPSAAESIISTGRL